MLPNGCAVWPSLEPSHRPAWIRCPHLLALASRACAAHASSHGPRSPSPGPRLPCPLASPGGRPLLPCCCAGGRVCRKLLPGGRRFSRIAARAMPFLLCCRGGGGRSPTVAAELAPWAAPPLPARRAAGPAAWWPGGPPARWPATVSRNTAIRETRRADRRRHDDVCGHRPGACRCHPAGGPPWRE